MTEIEPRPPPSASPFFVVGCPRSGTTLLRDLLRSHPRLTLPGESHFIPPLYAALGDPRSDAQAVKIARVLLACPLVARWNLSLAPEGLADCRSFAAMVRRIFGAWAEREGRPRWGDKTPQYVRHLSLLAQLFPDAKFIHIVRDGRDVALSFMKHPMGPHNVLAAARSWRDFVTAGRQSGRALGESRYFEVRYERLLSYPAPSLRELLAFLEEPFTEEVLERTPLPVPRFQPLGLNESRPMADNQGKWRHLMPRADRALFEWAAGDLLQELGYECEGATRPSRARTILLIAQDRVLKLAARSNPFHLQYLWPWAWMFAARWRARMSVW